MKLVYRANVAAYPSPYDVHKARRNIAYVAAENQLNVDPLILAPVELGPIDAAALATVQQWTNRSVNWDWATLVAATRRTRYARLDLAVWSGGVLCGLALGGFSRASTVLKLGLVEGSPHSHPLKKRVLYIAVAYGVVLGTAYKSRVFRAKLPAPHVRQALARLQPPFRYVASDPNVPYPYCERPLP